MDKEKMVKKVKIVEIICHNCGASLKNKEKTIAENPTVHFKAIPAGSKEEKTDIYLSAELDDFRKAGHKFPKGTVVKFFCPHCEKEFEQHNAIKCSTCKEGLIILHSKNGALGLIGICPKTGCNHHKTNDEIPTNPPLASP